MENTAEVQRLRARPGSSNPWRRWGPYLSERQWGTVREDYSPGGTAWEYFPHDHARSRAYRWGEDGLAGISDDQQLLCFAIGLWNGKDAILKERLFGLTNSEGNHGEDVKELYYYLDATPSHAYLKTLYKYPQAAFPYSKLLSENAGRPRTDPEFELLDTGIFDDNRYFDVIVEYAKSRPEEFAIRITLENCGPDPAELHLIPHLWFRNTWSWNPQQVRPEISEESGELVAKHQDLGEFRAQFSGSPELIFTDNDTNTQRVFGGPATPGFCKDAFHEYIIHGNRASVRADGTGTKAAAWYRLLIPAGEKRLIHARLARQDPNDPTDHTSISEEEITRVFEQRISEADAFYEAIHEDIHEPELRRIQRQALAGMIWSKQFYHIDIPRWLEGDPGQPAPPEERKSGRNKEWTTLNNADVISMPDKWEYPWYAAWDLAFHCIPLAQIDPEFAKDQLVLLAREWYMHPNGQLPAYEWAFGDVNPPVHAWAVWRVFQIDRKQRRRKVPSDPGDIAFIERVFHKLLLNFTWWVNRKDAQDRNIFQGGFLGLDNIGVFDRSKPLPTGGFINQADGTSWMAMYALNMMRIALEISKHNPVYQDVASKFFEHFLHIASAMYHVGSGVALWDDEDEFYYDVLQSPHGRSIPLKVRSMVGLIPLFAVEVLEPELAEQAPEFYERLEWFLQYRPDLARLVSRWNIPGTKDRRLLSLLRGHRMKRLLKRMLDETEFLSPYGVRALSRHHLENPFEFPLSGSTMEVRYEPAESASGLFGGNSNWRGPVWMPVNFLIVESLQRFHHYYGDEFRVECPTGSGVFMSLNQVADELAARLTRIFLPDSDGIRPCMRRHPRQAVDPRFRDHLLFHEYFHGEDGAGLGASHQTGWTGLIAKVLKHRTES